MLGDKKFNGKPILLSLIAKRGVCILRVLARFYKFTSGNIYIDGKVKQFLHRRK